MGLTQHYGLSAFGADGRLSDDGYKFSLRDRELLDTLIHTMMIHDHRPVSASVLSGPPSNVYLDAVIATAGGTLPAGRDYYYKFSYLDANGNETAASSAVTVSTPDPISPPGSQTLTTATTGGSLAAGTYKYALAFYQTAGGATTAPNVSTIVIPAGTSTNTITIPLPTIHPNADGWKIYRKGPGDLEYWLLDTQAAPATQYVDDGSINPDCTKKRPLANTTNSTNKITLSIPASELPLDSRIVSWRIYRTSTAGSYPANSLVATVVETTTEGGADLVTTYEDAGAALSLGRPLIQTSVPEPPPVLDAGDVFDASGDPLPAALAPRGVRAFNLLLPGTLAAKDYHQFVPPHDMYAERIDAFFLTLPTGLDGTKFLTLRFEDDATQNEIQSLYNDAIEENEVQTVYNNATGGTFTLTNTVDTTAAIAYNASAATIKTRLETDIAAITSVNVTGSGTLIDPWVIEYTNPGGTNVSQLQANDGGLIGGTSTIATTIQGSNGGTFTLSDGIDTTLAIAYNASAATIETRLQTDITSITDVTVTGAGTQAAPWRIEFVNPGAQNLDLLVVGDTLLNGTSIIVETTRGYGITRVDLVINQNQAKHAWQSAITDFGTQEAEVAPAISDGVIVSDTLALNDLAIELDAQNEEVAWTIGTLDAGVYSFFYWIADINQGSVAVMRLNEVTDEVQNLYNGATGGTFTITFDGATTNAIAYNASAATIEAELEALATVIDVTVTGAGTVGDPWVITFTNPSGNVPEITTNDAGLTGGTSTISTPTPGTTTLLASITETDSKPVYTPAYEITETLDGTQKVQMVVAKTDADTNKLRVDKFEYQVALPVLHGGSNVSCEILITGVPTTNGSDLQVTLWY